MNGTQAVIAGGSPSELFAHGNLLYLRMTSSSTFGGSRGSEPHVVDPVARVWRRLADIAPGRSSSSPTSFAAIGSRVVFSATNFSAGARELYITNGTTSGTSRLKDIAPGGFSSNPSWFTPLSSSTTLFSASTPTGGTELHVTNGTAAGTVLFKELESGTSTASSTPTNVTQVDGKSLIFSASDGASGREPWVTRGNTTTQLGDFNPGTSSSNPSGFTTFWNGSKTLTVFEMFTSAESREPWITDLTSAGTRRLRDILPGAGSSSPREFVAHRGQVFFSASDGDSSSANPVPHGRELWATDGTTNGTRLVADIDPGERSGRKNSSSPSLLVSSGARVYFAATTATNGRELWSSDGSAAGTRLARDIGAGTASSNPFNLVAVAGGRVVFNATTSTGRELWISDGTSAGTRVLTTLGGDPRDIVRAGDRVFFAYTTRTNGRELWTSDLTPAGTRMVVDLIPGAGSSPPRSLTWANGKLFFGAADSSGSGVELFVSDGTASGTRLVRDIDPGGRSSIPAEFIAADGGVYFAAQTQPFLVGAKGRELWFSDGTSAGTRFVCDLSPGNRSSSPRTMRVVDGRLYFIANSPTLGTELFRVRAPLASVEVLGHACGPTQSILESDDLRVGKTATIRGLDAPSQSAGLLFIGVPAPFPVPLPAAFMDSDCALWVNVFLPSLQLPLPPLVSSWSVPIPVPNDNSLIGTRLAAQAAYLPPVPFVTSRALGMRVGK